VKKSNRDKRETDRTKERRKDIGLMQKLNFYVTNNINLWELACDENNTK
jgi:hypothetical protein